MTPSTSEIERLLTSAYEQTGALPPSTPRPLPLPDRRRPSWVAPVAAAAAVAMVVGGIVLGGRLLGSRQPLPATTTSRVPTHTPTRTPTSATRTGPELYTVTTTVLDDGTPLLCRTLAQSRPPQCPDGIPVKGWDWSVATGVQSAGGVRWGEYTVVGRFDGKVFTLTEKPLEHWDPPKTAPPYPPAPSYDATPCPPPQGGWRPTDLTTATQAGLERAQRAAQGVPEVGRVWVDKAMDPTRDALHEGAQVSAWVLNVSTAGDQGAMERLLRARWGGAVCVSKARYAAARLSQIREELTARAPGGGNVMGEPSGTHVAYAVTYDAGGALQRQLDEQYGVDAVRVVPFLAPYAAASSAATRLGGEATGEQELVFRGTIGETPAHGVRLCVVSDMSMSAQPCGQVDVAGWDPAMWPPVGSPTVSTIGGLRQGNVELYGTYDGSTFTLTRPPRPFEAGTAAFGAMPDDSTPCPTPAGGWVVVDESKVSEAAYLGARSLAEVLPGYASFWVDWSMHPKPPPGGGTGDPRRLILNVAVVGDTRVAEERLREVYGGPLCVTTAKAAKGRLEAVQAEVMRQGDWLSVGLRRDGIQLMVIADEFGRRQKALDAAYGPGIVKVDPILKPA